MWIAQSKDPALEIKAHFETPKHKRTAQSEWSAISLDNIICSNPGKSISECLNLMITELQDLFYCLPDKLQNQMYWHMKLIEATSTHPGTNDDNKTAPMVSTLQTDTTICVNCHVHRTKVVHHIDEDTPKDAATYFILEHEGTPKDHNTQLEAYLAEVDIPVQYDLPDRTSDSQKTATGYFTVANLDYKGFAPLIASELANRSAAHYLSCLLGNHQEYTEKPTLDNEDEADVQTAPSSHHLTIPEYAFLAEDRYSSNNFIGLLIDTGAATFSTAGYAQYLAYRKVARGCIMDTSTAGSVTIRFGAGEALQSLGLIDLDTPIGNVRFHIVEAMTLFLLSIKDLDRLKVYYDNTKDLLVRHELYLTAPVVRRFGHPFLIWDYSLALYITQSFNEDQCFLTDRELRRLHRRFGHPSVGRLHKTLLRAGYDTHPKVIERINKFCHHYQTHGKSPGQFHFTLRDNIEFNHSIIVDIMYINGKPVLHIVDKVTRFNATFSVPVEAHWSISTVERYHAVLYRSYKIISEEVPELALEMALQMAVKAVNDTAGPDSYVPTLLIFRVYP
ncbi:hypothetical protein TSTA_081180 [Talaromyces stipitatus ATCC 10500]|uniref:GAG-pre-integrase domain-containing protein n=1 Tax=Talaromyces stipitatus (strain ATCC 10500 / CBS 375.48 / QM 6759 / NRRL 1006) TaxID=441959 RepID=B8LZV3_TALSN|nr:uncharacterized protein TSTA_081180 [Talaromyces stipitatus ATCC 10500]EED20885.1 hypothetical protein TSTA_081180 [Talaromyces stipitatus ATCC 10500]